MKLDSKNLKATIKYESDSSWYENIWLLMTLIIEFLSKK